MLIKLFDVLHRVLWYHRFAQSKLNRKIFQFYVIIIVRKLMKEDVMQVAKYLYQSPSSSPIQVGRLDPNSKKEEESSKANSLPQNVVNETAAKAQDFQSSMVQEVKPTVDQNRLDIYV